MGQAKRRGNYETRKQLAIATKHKTEELFRQVMLEKPKPNRVAVVEETMDQNLATTIAMALASTYRK